jgi:hypothetical protein
MDIEQLKTVVFAEVAGETVLDHRGKSVPGLMFKNAIVQEPKIHAYVEDHVVSRRYIVDQYDIEEGDVVEMKCIKNGNQLVGVYSVRQSPFSAQELKALTEKIHHSMDHIVSSSIDRQLKKDFEEEFCNPIQEIEQTIKKIKRDPANLTHWTSIVFACMKGAYMTGHKQTDISDALQQN